MRTTGYFEAVPVDPLLNGLETSQKREVFRARESLERTLADPEAPLSHVVRDAKYLLDLLPSKRDQERVDL